MKLLITALSLAVLTYACQKEFSSFRKSEKDAGSIQTFFNSNRAETQSFAANSSNYIFINTEKRNSIVFPDNAFITKNNAPVTGSVNIEIKEITTAGEMILNNAPTQSGGLPLISGGEFFVRVTKNGDELKLAPGKFIQVNMMNRGGADLTGMQVFNGDTSSGTVNWVPNNTIGNLVRDSFAVASLFADSLAWLNIDKFVNEPKIEYSVDPGNTPNRDSTAVFVHLTGQKSVFRFPSSGQDFSSQLMIPGDATLVGICVLDGKIYYAMKKTVMQNRSSAQLNFTEIGEEELKTKLSTLN